MEKGAVFILIFPLVFLAAEETSLIDYYQLDQSKPLRYALHDIIDDHNLVVYDQAKEVMQVLDADLGEPDNVLLIYSLRSELKTSSAWNREHVWPNSYGLDGINPSYSDLHNLRPADSNVNSSRGNLPYDVSDTSDSKYKKPAHSEATHSTKDSDSWEPPDQFKGDVARAAFYMATRYIGDQPGEPDLILTDDMAQISTHANFFGKLSTLLQWHKDDPPDDLERQRNDLIYNNYQGNRNPYIDRPEYADAVFADTSDADNDGLTAFDEVFIHRSDPDNADTSGDGLSDGQLVNQGIAPTISLKPLFSSVIQDTHFRSGGILVEKIGNQFQIKLTIEKSEDLKVWTAYQEQTILLDAVEGKQFLRVRAE